MKILSRKSWTRQVNIPAFILGAMLGSSPGVATIEAQGIRELPRQLPATPGQSVVSGKVVFEDTGLPAPKVPVQLVATRRTDSRPATPALMAVADERGEFKFNGVAEGEYSVIAQVDFRTTGTPSYSTPVPAGDANVDQARPGVTRISVDGRTNVSVELRVPNPHLGIISGYVLRAGGEVAAHTHVMCSSTNTNARFSLSVTTDDKGAFRFERVPPGEYLLNAVPPPRSQAAENVASGLASLSFVATYYPSTSDRASATPIPVAPDGETPGVNITLIELSVHRVSGNVKFRSGEAVAGVAVQLTPKATDRSAGDVQTPAGRVPQISFTDENGAWSFANVPDGDYVLRVDSRQVAPPRVSSANPSAPSGPGRPPTPKFTPKQLSLTVAGVDSTDVTIEVSRGGRISGSVVVEGDRPLPANVGIIAGGGNSTGSRPASSTIQADGSFALTGVPEGDVWIMPQLRPPNTFYVKAIDANGLDLMRSPLKLEDGGEIKNVRIVISSAVGVLTGRVLSANGNTPLARTEVILVPVEAEKQTFSGARFTGVSYADGTFTIGAAPGDYIVMAFPASEQPQFDSETLSRSKLRVSLQAGERKNFDILK